MLMGVMGMMMVLLAQAAPLPGAAPNQAEPANPVPDATLPLTVDVSSNMGRRFKLIEALVVMDGREISRRVAAAGQELEQQFRLYEGEVAPGPHAVLVTLVYEGRNMGLFTYLDDYKIRVRSSAEFVAQDRAHPPTVQVLAYERSGLTIPLEKRPTMEIKTGTVAPAGTALRGVTPPPR
jgi:hypothetical protein